MKLQKPQKRPEKCCALQLEYTDSKNNTIDYSAKRAECKNCGIIYEQNESTQQIYICKNQGTFIHMNCGKELDCIWRTHSLWDKRFECAGDGSVDRYPIPFCSKHEEKPSAQGLPIYY